jgi:DNA adenine methylase
MRYLGGKSRIAKPIAEIIERERERVMQYQGGKARIAKPIALALERESNTLVSLFCGSCSIESKVNIPNKICNDKHPYLIAMWKALQEGWIPPDIITEDEYKYIRDHKDENPALTGFVGFGCSFGGKWFGGMARNKKGDNYCARANRSLLKDFEGLKDAKFTCLDYKDVEIPMGR